MALSPLALERVAVDQPSRSTGANPARDEPRRRLIERNEDALRRRHGRDDDSLHLCPVVRAAFVLRKIEHRALERRPFPARELALHPRLLGAREPGESHECFVAHRGPAPANAGEWTWPLRPAHSWILIAPSLPSVTVAVM